MEPHTEALTEQQICKVLGINPKRSRGTCRFEMDTHRAHSELHLNFDELVTVPGSNEMERKLIPFRVLNLKTGESWTKLSGDFYIDGRELKLRPLDAAKVDAIYAEAMAVQTFKSFIVEPLIFAACPDIDPGNSALAEITIGGRTQIGDLEDGRIINLRDRPPFPAWGVDRDGKLVVHVHHLPEAHQHQIADALIGSEHAPKISLHISEEVTAKRALALASKG